MSRIGAKLRGQHRSDTLAAPFPSSTLAAAMATAVVAELAATDPEALWCERDGWSRLQAAGCQLRNSGHLSPEDSAHAVFDACAACGHSTLLTDYVHDICADPEKSTANASFMALLDGNVLSRWLHRACSATDAELRSICDTGNDMSDASKLAQMRTRVLTCAQVNAALQEAGLPSKAAPAGALCRPICFLCACEGHCVQRAAWHLQIPCRGWSSCWACSAGSWTSARATQTRRAPRTKTLQASSATCAAAMPRCWPLALAPAPPRGDS